MYAKLLIEAKLEIVTGLHIGAGGSYSAIGAADSPVIRDVRSHLPMIPGSSLKGKIRTLLARKHCCCSGNPAEDKFDLKKAFGAPGERSKLIFNDIFLDMAQVEKMRALGVMSTTEVKFENSIDRLRATANPRQIERVIPGCIFDFNMICDAESKEDAENSIRLLAEGIKLLQLDYLGGHGSRGYGKVKFSGFTVECVAGDLPRETVETWQDKLNNLKEAEGK